MNPAKVIREQVVNLIDLPNIGQAMAQDLRLLGITHPDDLRDQDPCVIDVFISIIRFMQGDEPKPWWQYTAERKAYLNKS